MKRERRKERGRERTRKNARSGTQTPLPLPHWPWKLFETQLAFTSHTLSLVILAGAQV